MSASHSSTDGTEPIKFRAALAAFQNQSQPLPQRPHSSIHSTSHPNSKPYNAESAEDPTYIASKGDGNSFSNPFLSRDSSVSPIVVEASSTSVSSRKPEVSTISGGERQASLPSPDNDARQSGNKSSAGRDVSSASTAHNLESENPWEDCASLSSSPQQGRVKQFISSYSGGQSTSARSASPSPMHSGLSPNTNFTSSKTGVSRSYLGRGRAPIAAVQSSNPNSAASSPERRDSTASSSSYASAEPQVMLGTPNDVSRKSSGSSVSSLPRLPPRPAALAPSPTISEFGQISTPAQKNDGVRRQGINTTTGAMYGATEGTMSPPAVPPRSVTLGHASPEVRGSRLAVDDLGASTYAVRQKSPLKSAIDTGPATPTSTSKKVKPTPPPRPSNRPDRPWDGNGGGFRFGTPVGGADQASVSSVTASAQPMLPQRPSQRSNNAAVIQGGNVPRIGSAQKQASANRRSNVFTSINLNEDAAQELRRTLDQSPHRSTPPGSPLPSAFQPPPSARSRPSHNAHRPGSIGGSAGSLPAPTGISSLLGSAASALPIPLFKSASNSGMTSRALADGAPSKQGTVSTRTSHSYGLHPDSDFPGVRPGEISNDRRLSTPSNGRDARLLTRAVVLAEARPVQSTKLMDPANEEARRRYEALFRTLLAAQDRAKAKKGGMITQTASNASTLRGFRDGEREKNWTDGATQDGDTSHGSIRSTHSLRGWFEPGTDTGDNNAKAQSTNQTSMPRTSGEEGGACTDKRQESVSAKRVVQIWKRSQLPDPFLAEIWEAALAFQNSEKLARTSLGLHQEAFVKAMAALDSELSRRKARAQRRLAKKEAAITPAISSNSTGAVAAKQSAGQDRQFNPVDGDAVAMTRDSSNASSNRSINRVSTTSLHEPETVETAKVNATGSRRVPPPPPPPPLATSLHSS